MAFNASVIPNSVDYWMQTVPLDPPGTGRKGIIVGTPLFVRAQTPNNPNPPQFWIKTLTFTNSTKDAVTSGQMTITFDNPKVTDIYSLLKEGDCFRIWEVFGSNGPLDQQTSSAVFTGYISAIKYSISAGHNHGTEVTYYFYNFFGQWALQAGVTSTQTAITQGLTDLFSNQIPFGQLLSLLVSGSLFQYFLEAKGGFQLTAGSSYNGIPLPVDLDPTSLQLTDKLWVYAPTNMPKLDVLERALYPYQEIVYTQPSGEISIGYFNTSQRATESAFIFSLGSPPDAKSGPNAGSVNYTRADIVRSAAMVPNAVISTLVNMPFVPPVDGKPNNFISSVDNPFTRPKELLDSGFFEILEVQTDSINPNMITDPTLMTLLTSKNPQTGYVTQVVQGSPSVAGTYSARRLAQANFQETAMFITQPRSEAPSAGITPLGKMVSVVFPTMLEPSQLYCHTTVTTFGPQGTTFMLQLCKPGSLTAYWESK